MPGTRRSVQRGPPVRTNAIDETPARELFENAVPRLDDFALQGFATADNARGWSPKKSDTHTVAGGSGDFAERARG